MKILKYIILFLLLASPVWAADHDLTEALGETITEATFGGVNDGDTITINADRTSPIYFDGIVGSSGNEITIRNSASAKVTISGNTSSWANCVVFIDSRYFKFLGNNYGSETYGIKLQNGNGMRMLRCKDYEIAYVEFYNTGAGPTQNNNIDWTQSDGPIQNVSIHNNYIHDTTSHEGTYFGKTDIGDHPQFEDIQIYDNIITNTYRDCLQLSQSTGSNNNIYGNVLTNCGAGGEVGQNFGISVYVEAGGLEIYQNKVSNTGKMGINVDGGVTGVVKIHDNVVWNAGTGEAGNGIKIGYGSTNYAHEVINNTVITSTRYGIDVNDSLTNAIIRYNLLLDHDTGNIDHNTANISDNKCPSGCDHSATNIAAEYFENAATGNFDLTYQSPAINLGAGAGYSTTDYDGSTRPYGSTDADIGAYEYDFKADSISPADGDKDVNVEVEPTWNNPTTTTGVDVYWDESSCPAGVPTKVVTDSLVATYDPGTLTIDTTYCMRIDLIHAGGTETGTVLEFTTTEGPPPPVTGLCTFLYDDGGLIGVFDDGGASVE